MRIPGKRRGSFARAYDIEPAIARETIRSLTIRSPEAALPYWGAGRFDLVGMNRLIAGERQSGLRGVDWSKIIDRSLLPPDLQKDY